MKAAFWHKGCKPKQAPSQVSTGRTGRTVETARPPADGGGKEGEEGAWKVNQE